MGKLRVFEIDAVVNSICKEVENYNEKIGTLSIDEINEQIIKDEPLFHIQDMLQNQIDQLNQQKQEVERNVESKYKNTKYAKNTRWFDKIKENFQKEAQEKLGIEKGYIYVNRNDIKQKVILSSSVDLTEIVNNILKELNIK